MQAQIPDELVPVIERLDRIEKLLTDREGRTIPDRPMSPREFAKAVGKSAKTVGRWINAGKLKAKREGRVTLITPVNAQRFLKGDLT